jgi:glutamine cyclotransferase
MTMRARATRIIAGMAAAVSLFAFAGARENVRSNARAIAPRALHYRVVAVHPHSAEMFTEGLAFAHGEIYESGGRYGSSRVCKLDLASGEARGCVSLAASFFGEGLTVFGERVLQLTWRNGVGLIYDRGLQRTGEFEYAGEGWGLASDGSRLLMSDGSSSLRELDASTFHELRRIPITAEGHPLESINELEYARGRVWANIWHSDRIAVIDLARGRVDAWLDLSGLRERFEKPQSWDERENVLNGIAYDPRSSHFYVTGKCWPVLFEIDVGK